MCKCDSACVKRQEFGGLFASTNGPADGQRVCMHVCKEGEDVVLLSIPASFWLSKIDVEAEA